MKRAATAQELTELATTLRLGAMLLVNGMETFERSFADADVHTFGALLCQLKEFQDKCEVRHVLPH